MLKIAVCDDNKYICADIENILRQYGENSDSKFDIDLYYTGEELIEKMSNDKKYDLIFMDIELNTTTGIIVGTKIRNELENYISKIVFITSVEGYQNQLFDIQPFGYIKKPVDMEQVVKYAKLCLKVLDKEKFVFKYQLGHEFKQIEVKNILFFENKLRKVKITTCDFSEEFYGTIKEVKTHLPENFILVHASYIVNLKYIKTVLKDSVILQNGIIIPVSKSNLKELRKELVKEVRDAEL